MRCLLIYDIPEDKIRTKIATFCLDYGLDRVQYSAFAGELSSNHQEELMLKLGRKLGKAPGKIDLFPMCREDWRNRISLCNADSGGGEATTADASDAQERDQEAADE